MGDIAQRGNRLTTKKFLKSSAGREVIRNVYDAVAPKHSPGQKKKPHSSKEGRTASIGRTARDIMKILAPERDRKFGGGRTNLLEELGRVEAEPSNRNRRAEISRVHGELNRGYAIGGGVKKVISKLRPGVFKKKGKKTHGKDVPTMAAKGGVVRRPKKPKTHGKDVPTMAAEGGRIGLRTGGPHPKNVKKWISPPGKRRKMGKPPKAGGPTHINPQWREGGKKLKFGSMITDTKNPQYLNPFKKGGRIGLKHGTKPWGTGPKPGTLEFFQSTTQTPKRKSKAIGGPAARAIKQALKPKGEFKKDKFKNPWEKPPQLRKSQKERREELRKKARKSGGHSKIVFHDEWKHIDPGLQKGLFKKDGGRIGKFGGGALIKHAIKKLRPGVVKPKKKVYPETEDLTHQKGPYVGDVGSEGKRRRAGPSAGRGKSPGRSQSPGRTGRRSWRDRGNYKK